MSTCNIDHSNQDVFNKLQSQQEFMPASLFEKVKVYLEGTPGQDELNALFHLLKKYDLASREEQEARYRNIIQLTSI